MSVSYDTCMEIGSRAALAAFGCYDVSMENMFNVLGIDEPSDFAVWQVIANVAYQAAFAAKELDR